MDIQIINNLSTTDKKILIDYIECAPGNINRYVKAHINDANMNPEISRSGSGNKIQLCNASSLCKYLDADAFNLSQSDSYYQKEYCSIKQMIMNLDIPYIYGKKLLILLDQPSDDYESLSKLEIQISEILSSVIPEKINETMAYFIDSYIMPFKCKAYDFFTKINVSPILGSMLTGSYKKMELIVSGINKIIDNPPYTYKELYNLGLLIKIYFKEIGIEKIIIDKKLYARFIGHHKYIAKLNFKRDRSDEIMEMISKDCELSQSNYDLIHGLALNSSDIMSDDEKININGNTENSIERENYIFLSKDISHIQDILDDVILNMKVLSKHTITEYLDDITENNIYFNLSDNSIGNVQNLIKTDVGTVIDTNSMENKFIINHNDKLYLLFKLNDVYSSIFGIGIIPDENGSRHILHIPENRNLIFKYTNNI